MHEGYGSLRGGGELTEWQKTKTIFLQKETHSLLRQTRQPPGRHAGRQLAHPLRVAAQQRLRKEAFFLLQGKKLRKRGTKGFIHGCAGRFCR